MANGRLREITPTVTTSSYWSQVYLALALPTAFATVTVKVWDFFFTTFSVSGDEHGFSGAPSREQLTLVGEPVVVQANLGGADRERGTRVNLTVGRAAWLPETGAVTVQPCEAVVEPPSFVTVSTKLWLPTARPVYVVGDEQALATAASSEQVVLVGEPVVVQLKDVLVEVVEAAGTEPNVTVGAVTPGAVPDGAVTVGADTGGGITAGDVTGGGVTGSVVGGGVTGGGDTGGGDTGGGDTGGGELEPESTSEPKFCVQYRTPFAWATPMPIAR